jgi:hypothetical protein
MSHQILLVTIVIFRSVGDLETTGANDDGEPINGASGSRVNLTATVTSAIAESLTPTEAGTIFIDSKGMKMLNLMLSSSSSCCSSMFL